MLPEKDAYSLNYVKEGKGQTTLVFLHYFGGSCRTWAGVIAQLKENFVCIAIDLPGFGNSPAPGKQPSVEDAAKEVLTLIRTLKLKKFILVGHSMGGKIALYLASQFRKALTSLILVAPSPPTPEPTSARDKKKLSKAFGDPSAIEKLIKKITVKPLPQNIYNQTVEDHLKIAAIAWQGWIEKGSRQDISALMQQVSVPLLVISGQSDPNFSTAFLRQEFSNYFPQASFKEIAGAGHLLPLEVPAEIAKAILEFYKDTSGSK